MTNAEVAGRPRPCPFCRAAAGRPAHPLRSRYESFYFRYWRCEACAVVYIDPVPTLAIFERMYATGEYHEDFYDGKGQSGYAATARRLAAALPRGASVLDFGCGGGHLLEAIKQEGLDPAGIEFSAFAADRAAARAGVEVFVLGDSSWRLGGQQSP